MKWFIEGRKSSEEYEFLGEGRITVENLEDLAKIILENDNF